MSLTDEFLAEMRREFPTFRVVPKAESPLSKVIDVALRLVTFNQQNQYLTHYYTVIFTTLYTPASWSRADDLDRVITLRHERVHLRQLRRHGHVGMTFLYLVPFFPLGLAYGRARIEWEAYAETLRATAELRGLGAARSPQMRQHIIKQFTSGAYGWMWPFRRQVERWYDEALEQIASEVSVVAHGATRMPEEG